MVVLNVLSFLSLILLILLNGQTDVPSRPLCSAPRSFQELHPRPAGRRAIRSRPARRRTTSSARRSRSTRTEKLERARFRLYRSQILQVYSNSIFVRKLLTRSTRFTYFCTTQTSIFQKKIRQTCSHFSAKSYKIMKIYSFSKFFH